MRRLALIALLGMVGCITPSIPIPPPDPARMTFTLTVVGTVTTTQFSYPADSNYVGGTTYVFDRNNGQGVFQLDKPDGSVGPTLPLPAMLGDNVVVSVENIQQTVSTCVVLREGTQDAGSLCHP